ncbi:hypothetical protein N7450_009306 [Penicillium hetheringtonii]|uniref:Uncharacterized protein n=1 Tax=Penicillium hetheringtonii TaxID=911720 RepID=A0AAD6DES7_9EURO|nr:hypothetical protein N7450_009306 [Penicillium hetheringtonii]
MKFSEIKSFLKPSHTTSDLPRVYSDKASDSTFKSPKTVTGDFQLASVIEELSELQKTHKHVLVQLREVERLRLLKDFALDASEKTWIDGTINDIQDAARDVALLLEPTRVQKETGNGRLSIGSQLRWKYHDSKRARDRKDRMIACHNSLMSVLNHLQRVEAPQHGRSVPDFSRSRIRADSVANFEDTRSVEIPDIRTQELNDLLAWRRSKGSPIHTSEELEIADGAHHKA